MKASPSGRPVDATDRGVTVQFISALDNSCGRVVTLADEIVRRAVSIAFADGGERMIAGVTMTELRATAASGGTSTGRPQILRIRPEPGRRPDRAAQYRRYKPAMTICSMAMHGDIPVIAEEFR